MRLIDADELMKNYGFENATKYGNKNAKQQEHSYSTMMLYEIADVIEDAPTIDAVPVVRGEWIEIEQPGWSRSGYNATARIKCSECDEEAFNYSNTYREHNGSTTEYRWIKTNFCPNCGADMRKKVKE